jgi:diguanylate cyclase (GGDEF)-like protein
MMDKDGSVELVDPQMLSYLKTAVHWARRNKAEEQESLRPKTHHRAILESIDKIMAPVDEFMHSEWFAKAEAFVMPPLTDYLTLAEVNAAFPGQGQLESQPLHDKFGILYADRAFIPSLRYHRRQAQFRNIETTVAFVDIDDFKAFNTKFGNPIVDAEFLPVVIRTIEAHLYSHGMAFQVGGDEFVLLLPNMGHDLSVKYLIDLQRKVTAISIPNITDQITLSIGTCLITPNSFLTDTEVLQKANAAMRYGKTWKNCIAGYKDSTFDEKDLYVVTSNGHVPRGLDKAKAASQMPDN